MSFVPGEYVTPPPESALATGEVTGALEYVLGWATLPEREILLKIEKKIQRRHRYVEYKIRCKQVAAGESFMDMDRPHYDVTMDLGREETPEFHHLWTTPPAPIFYTVSPELEVIKAPVPECHILTYSRFSLHQTVVADRPMRRLLIRATESDIVRPRNEVKGR